MQLVCTFMVSFRSVGLIIVAVQISSGILALDFKVVLLHVRRYVKPDDLGHKTRSS